MRKAVMSCQDLSICMCICGSGLEYKEDIQTGGAAALHGGFTTIVAMPNTKPVADRPT